MLFGLGAQLAALIGHIGWQREAEFAIHQTFGQDGQVFAGVRRPQSQ